MQAPLFTRMGILLQKTVCGYVVGLGWLTSFKYPVKQVHFSILKKSDYYGNKIICL